MASRNHYRIGAAVAIMGAIAATATSTMHPRLSTTSAEEHLAEIAGISSWVPLHLAILFAFLVLLGGILVLCRSLDARRENIWASWTHSAAVVSAAVLATVSAVDGVAVKAAADLWAAAPEEEKTAALYAAQALEKADVGLFALFMITLFGLVPLLLGVAVATSYAYPRILGAIGIAAGAIGLYGGTSMYLTSQFPTMSLNIASILFTALVLTLGVLMWRRAGELAARDQGAGRGGVGGG